MCRLRNALLQRNCGDDGTEEDSREELCSGHSARSSWCNRLTSELTLHKPQQSAVIQESACVCNGWTVIPWSKFKVTSV
ncbi:unnamed protein product [Hermetia illucens]|uniref:Uncharacterized protein n=1 Tax=Hermetia illucens TaxID=343691 RepID=A0A7R8YNN2_HERIL|nr:unnamed protein product [Hermetia illucens]